MSAARTPWDFGGSGAPEGEVWVWESVDPSVEDGRLFSTTPNVAEQVVLAVNAHEDLVSALAGIIEIGKRDLRNPKYDAYFEFARTALKKARGE